MSNESIFSSRVLLGWIAGAAALFALSLYLMGGGETAGTDSVGPGTFSRSAIGHAGIAEVLTRLGISVGRASTTRWKNFRPAASWLSLSPDLAASPRSCSARCSKPKPSSWYCRSGPGSPVSRPWAGFARPTSVSWVMRNRSLLVGQSMGGFATIATAATNPEGVIASPTVALGSALRGAQEGVRHYRPVNPASPNKSPPSMASLAKPRACPRSGFTLKTTCFGELMFQNSGLRLSTPAPATQHLCKCHLSLGRKMATL